MPSDRYTTDSYRRAIERACDAAFPHPKLANVPASKLTPEQREELEAWKKAHRWTPHRLRHNAAAYIAEHESIEVAQLMLGHQSISTTIRYAKASDQRAVLAALRRG